MSEQTQFKDCCVTGHIHEGQPLGNFEVIHGFRTYVSNSKPAQDGSKQDIVIFLTDIFGPDLNNVKILADSWAGQGFKVLVPDFFEGSAISHDHLSAIVPTLKQQEEKSTATKLTDKAVAAANLGPFLLTNREAAYKPKIEAFFKAIRDESSTGKITSVGFCFGGRYALLLANHDSPGKVDCGIAYHPAFLSEADVQGITDVPVAILKGTRDDMMSDEDLDKVEATLKKNLGDKLLVKRFDQAVHGFAVRGDDNAPREKGFKEEGANAGIQFVKKWTN